MGRLVKIAVVLALLWGGWWWAGATLIETGAARWQSDQRAAGLNGEWDDLAVTGFPLQFRTDLSRVTFTDPRFALRIDAETLRLEQPAYWPGALRLTLPAEPLQITFGAQPFLLRSTDAEAWLRLRPGMALALDRLGALSGPWALNTAQGNLLGADDLRVEVTQNAQSDASYRIETAATGFAPGDLARDALGIDASWPRRFDALAADVVLTLDRPLDRYTAEGGQIQPRGLTINRLDLRWGDLILAGSGTVEIDNTGIPAGEVGLRVENWRALMGLAEDAGYIAADERARTEIFLNALANMGGNPETLDLTLSFRDGAAFLGPIALGPVPPLFLR